MGFWSEIYSEYFESTFLSKYGEVRTAIYIISIYTIIIGLLMVSPFRFAHAANILLGKTRKYWMLLLLVLLIIIMFEIPYNSFIYSF